MEITISKKTRTIQFWDGYAKWYKFWIEHNNYHDHIEGERRYTWNRRSPLKEGYIKVAK